MTDDAKREQLEDAVRPYILDGSRCWVNRYYIQVDLAIEVALSVLNTDNEAPIKQPERDRECVHCGYSRTQHDIKEARGAHLVAVDVCNEYEAKEEG